MASLPTGSNYLTYAGSFYIYYYLSPGSGDIVATEIYSYSYATDNAVLRLAIDNGGPVYSVSGSGSDAIFRIELQDGEGATRVYGTDACGFAPGRPRHRLPRFSRNPTFRVHRPTRNPPRRRRGRIPPGRKPPSCKPPEQRPARRHVL